MTIPITGAVEGAVDETVARRTLTAAGATVGPVYIANGKPALRTRLSGYNNAARFAPWLVLVDLDNDEECAPPFRNSWLPAPAEWMCFRVVVREIESWLLADRERFARFMGVSAARLPRDPDGVDSPRDVVVNLARRSRRRVIREDMVPRAGSGRRVGPLYPGRLIEFVSAIWRPQEARSRSESLDRCLQRLEELLSRASEAEFA